MSSTQSSPPSSFPPPPDAAVRRSSSRSTTASTTSRARSRKLTAPPASWRGSSYMSSSSSISVSGLPVPKKGSSSKSKSTTSVDSPSTSSRTQQQDPSSVPSLSLVFAEPEFGASGTMKGKGKGKQESAEDLLRKRRDTASAATTGLQAQLSTTGIGASASSEAGFRPAEPAVERAPALVEEPLPAPVPLPIPAPILRLDEPSISTTTPDASTPTASSSASELGPFTPQPIALTPKPKPASIPTPTPKPSSHTPQPVKRNTANSWFSRAAISSSPSAPSPLNTSHSPVDSNHSAVNSSHTSISIDDDVPAIKFTAAPFPAPPPPVLVSDLSPPAQEPVLPTIEASGSTSTSDNTESGEATGSASERLSPPPVVRARVVSLSRLNPSASRFTLAIPFLGRPKIPLELLQQGQDQDKLQGEEKERGLRNAKSCDALTPDGSKTANSFVPPVGITPDGSKITDPLGSKIMDPLVPLPVDFGVVDSDSSLTAENPTETSATASNQQSTASWWSYVGWSEAQTTQAQEAAKKLSVETSSGEEGESSGHSTSTSLDSPSTAAVPALSSDTAHPETSEPTPAPGTLTDYDRYRQEPGPSANAQKTVSDDTKSVQTMATSASTWLPWGWYYSSPAPASSQALIEAKPKPEDPKDETAIEDKADEEEGYDATPLTESQMIRRDVMERDRQEGGIRPMPQVEENPSNVGQPQSADPARSSSKSPTAELSNPMTSSIYSNPSGWVNFLTSSTRMLGIKSVQAAEDADKKKGPGDMEVMDLDEEEGDEVVQVARPEVGNRPQGAQLEEERGRDTSIKAAGQKATRPANTPLTNRPAGTPLTTSKDVKQRIKEAENARPASASPAPDSGNATKRGKAMVPEPKEKPKEINDGVKGKESNDGAKRETPKKHRSTGSTGSFSIMGLSVGGKGKEKEDDGAASVKSLEPKSGSPPVDLGPPRSSSTEPTSSTSKTAPVSKKSKSQSPSPAPKSPSGATTPAPKSPNLVLPTWDDTFNTRPRSTIPPSLIRTAAAAASLPVEGGSGTRLSRTMRFVKAALFQGNAQAIGGASEAEKEWIGHEKERERTTNFPAHPSFVRRDTKEREVIYAEFGRELPRAWEVMKRFGMDGEGALNLVDGGAGTGTGRRRGSSHALPPPPLMSPPGPLGSPGPVASPAPMSPGLALMGMPSVGEVMNEEVLRGCERVVVIGVHGWFPGTVMRTVIGEPTGTSTKLANMMVEALDAFQEAHGVKFKKVSNIPLEGEGTINRRLDKLYTSLTSNQEWMDDLHEADVIFISAHSQGTVVSTHILDRLLRDGHIVTSPPPDPTPTSSPSVTPSNSADRKLATAVSTSGPHLNAIVSSSGLSGRTGAPSPAPPPNVSGSATQQRKVQRVCCLALCGIHLGPLRYLNTSSVLQPYFQYFESTAARELFEFQNTGSEVSKAYVGALTNVLDNRIKMVYVASLDDQVVPIYSGLFTSASHPSILRALYIDGDAYHSSDFLSNLLVLLLRVLNTGLSDSGLISHLSEATAGSLSGVGHSTAYEELGTYRLAVDYLFLANDGLDKHPPLSVEPFNAMTEQNDYEIPWSLRDLIADERIVHFFAEEIMSLRDAFREWHPKTTILRDVKRKLQPIQKLPSTTSGAAPDPKTAPPPPGTSKL